VGLVEFGGHAAQREPGFPAFGFADEGVFAAGIDELQPVAAVYCAAYQECARTGEASKYHLPVPGRYVAANGKGTLNGPL
jgi:hypothetical protein